MIGLLILILFHGVASDELCDEETVDDVFFPPFEYDDVVIIKYPKYYLFNLQSGQITKDGLVKKAWFGVDRPPAAVFRWAEPKHKMLENWFKDSRKEHPPDSEGYIVFYMTKLAHELIIYKVIRGEDPFKQNDNEYVSSVSGKLAQQTVSSASQGICHQSSVWFFQEDDFFPCETSILDTDDQVNLNFTCENQAFGRELINQLFPSLESVGSIRAIAIHTLNETELKDYNKFVPDFMSILIVDDKGRIFHGHRGAAKTMKLEEKRISSLKYCSKLTSYLIIAAIICTVIILLLVSTVIVLCFKKSHFFNESFPSSGSTRESSETVAAKKLKRDKIKSAGKEKIRKTSTKTSTPPTVANDAKILKHIW